jgi:hypothetical protein
VVAPGRVGVLEALAQPLERAAVPARDGVGDALSVVFGGWLFWLVAVVLVLLLLLLLFWGR